MEHKQTLAALLAAASRRRHLAAQLGAEPGGLVLVATFRADAGVMISRDPGGAWRATRFDLDGFSGHDCYATKAEAIRDCLSSYADKNRNALRECMKSPRFMAGVHRSFEIEQGFL